MGLFNRKRDKDDGGDKGGRDHPGFGHAAFDEADLDDARRGHPAVGLQSFAAATRLEFRGTEQAGAFVATLPTWPDYIFNVCRGVMPGGRYGMVAHELYEVRASSAASSHQSVRNIGQFVGLKENRQVLGFGIASGPEKNEPFWGNAIWIPTTTVHVRAPETNALAVLKIARSSSYGLQGDNGLDHLGLAGYRTLGPDLAPAEMEAAAAACRPWLPARNDAHTELKVRFGVVALTVNGYRADPDDLRHLMASAEGVADALAAHVRPSAEVSFDDLGPPAGRAASSNSRPAPHPQWVRRYAQQAEAWHLHHEDHTHLIGLAPRCPIPGYPSGVLTGVVPGTSAVGRVVWMEQGGRTAGSVRGGLVLPAKPGAVTPVGGQLDERTGMYAEVVDQIAYCWRRNRSFESLEADTLVAAGLQTLRTANLVAV